MPGIASAATAVVIGHIAGGTSTIRVGAGGIMLPNHAPLVIAEQFGTLAALFPGRIDLGVGRAPGTDPRTALALRRTSAGRSRQFSPGCAGVDRLSGRSRSPGQAVRAIPGEGSKVPVWMLGSSLYGAQLAAALGLPYAFASHFAPDDLDPGAGALSRPVPAFAVSRQALCDAGAECGGRRHGRRGQTPFHLLAAGLSSICAPAIPDRCRRRCTMRRPISPIRASGRCWRACCRWRKWDRPQPSGPVSKPLSPSTSPTN